MKKLTHAEISINRATLESVPLVRKMPVVVILNNIRSTYNVGSIFRTSDGAMVEKIYLTGFTPVPPKKEILKTALGSVDSVAWEYREDPLALIKELKELGYTIGALELAENSVPYYAVQKASYPLALIIGNEITGVNQDLLDQCSLALEIPQYGIKQSLNVAVAYGVAIFELRKIFEDG
ncbi:MAG: RNA methyltransferase [Ignavibacteriales bacterium]|nr:RNA methyltransferase [Ignavibacteriales bacterium]